jgi:hypothetical protein
MNQHQEKKKGEFKNTAKPVLIKRIQESIQNDHL